MNCTKLWETACVKNKRDFLNKLWHNLLLLNKKQNFLSSILLQKFIARGYLESDGL